MKTTREFNLTKRAAKSGRDQYTEVVPPKEWLNMGRTYVNQYWTRDDKDVPAQTLKLTLEVGDA